MYIFMYLYLRSQTSAVYNCLVVFPCGALDMLKMNRACTVSAAGWAKARLAWPGHAAGSLGIMPSTRILVGSLLDPHYILFLSPFPPNKTTLASLPHCLGKRTVTKAEQCTCARGAVFLFGVLPRFFHPGENLLGETGVCTEVGFAGGSFTAARLVIAVATGAVGGRV